MPAYGPTLPPGFRKLDSMTSESETEASTSGTDGALLDPSQKDADDEITLAESSSSSKGIPQIGPVCPPRLLRRDGLPPNNLDITVGVPARQVAGPVLPPWYQRNGDDSEEIIESSSIGAECYDELEDDVMGPSIALMASDADFSVAKELAERLSRRADRLKKSQEPTALERESWMTDLPEALMGRNVAPQLPTESRTFKRRAGDHEADFSGWTAGPGEKNRKLDDKDSIDVLQYQQQLDREKKLEGEIAKHNLEKRSEALATMVQKQKKTTESTERRPFDREKDLSIQKIGRMDQEEIMKRATALKERFASSGKTGKFL